MSVLLQNSLANDPVFQFLDKKRAEGKPYYVYMTAGANKFLRVYYGRVKEYLLSFEAADWFIPALTFRLALWRQSFCAAIFISLYSLHIFLNLRLTFYLQAISIRSNRAKVVGIILWYQPLYLNKEKDCISPPREDNVHFLDRGGVQYEPTRTAHSIGD